MAHTVTLAEAKVRLDDLIEGVHRGEEWLITNGDGKPVAKIAAAAPDEPKVDSNFSAKDDNSSLIGLMAGEIIFLPGWDDPLEEFEPYT